MKNMNFESWNVQMSAPRHLILTNSSILRNHTYISKDKVIIFPQIISTVVNITAKLENFSGNASRLRSFSHLRWGEGSFAKILYFETGQLRFQAELYEAWTMGHRLCNSRWWYSANYTPQQEFVSGTTWWLQRRIVSNFFFHIIFTPY